MRQVRILPNYWRGLGDSGEEISLMTGEDLGATGAEYFGSTEAE
jgi:hypothetical protein